MFSVSTYRLAHGQSDVTLDIFGTLPRRGLWEIFGEIDEAVYSGNISNCTGIESASFDCKFRSAVIIVLMAVYLFMTTILLVNLLIAANTKIFEKANAQAENSWRCNLYFLLRTYQTAAILPWPFAFVESWLIGGYYECKKLIAQIVSTKKKAESDDVEKQEQLAQVSTKKKAESDDLEKQKLLERKVEPSSATFEKANDDMQEFAPMKQLDADIFERDIGAEYFARLKVRQ